MSEPSGGIDPAAAAEPSQAFLDRFLALHPRKIDLSLQRIEALLARLGHPERSLPPVIHVAGTNGKGSTIAFMRAMLEAEGKRAHVYTSPHLVSFHERIRLGAAGRGRLVDEARLVAAFAACEEANAGAPITVFEMTTAAAIKLFAEHEADFLLLEVGLGGRYDATNVVDRPAACVISPVSMDHVEFLGNSLAAIAAEKAGIIKPGVPVVVAPQADEAFGVIEGEAQRLRAPLIVAGQDFQGREENGRFVYEDERGLLDMPLPRLRGRHQLLNAAVAIATLRQVLPAISAQSIEAGLRNAEWPARLQQLRRGPLVDLAPAGAELWLDGAHNEAGGQVLAAAMADMEERSPRPLVLVCGTLATKDTAGFLRQFRGLAREVLAIPVAGEHAARTAGEVAAIAQAEGIGARTAAGAGDALAKLALETWTQPPRILIAGSLYLAGDVLRENLEFPS